MTAKKKDKDKKDLKDFEIQINPLGEMERNVSIDQINAFLDKHVEDKKLRDRSDEEE